MIRLLSFIMLASCCCVVVAQDKPKEKAKEKAKGLPRIAINELTELKGDKDFAIQGEYLGHRPIGDDKELIFGVQVFALGEGKFQAKLYGKAGLPGMASEKYEMVNAGISTLKDNKVVWAFDAGVEKLQLEHSEGKLHFSNRDGDKKTLTLNKVNRLSPTLSEKPPEGAVVLFGAAGDEKNWTGGKLVKLSDGEFLNNGIKSEKKFQSFKAHVEFRLPWMPNSRGQQRGNSGVYLQDRYEVQVLDSFGLNGENNECAGIYQQHKPLVNMCFPPMVWQTYDIDFTAATFDADGKRKTPARLTLKHNGVLVHDNVEFKGNTGGGQPEGPAPGPLQFQNHGDPVVYRNIWVVEK